MDINSVISGDNSPKSKNPRSPTIQGVQDGVFEFALGLDSSFAPTIRRVN